MTDVAINGVFEASVSSPYGSNSYAATYAAARAGTRTKRMYDFLGNWGAVSGQMERDRIGGAYYWSCYQSGLRFDLSGLDPSWEITAVSLTAFAKHVGADKGQLVEVRLYDYGSSYNTGDFIPGASLGSYTLMASADVTALTQGTTEAFTCEAALLALVADPSSRPETLRLVLSSSLQRLGTAPAWPDDEIVGFTTPVLTVTVSGCAITSQVDAATEVDVTKSGMAILVEAETQVWCSMRCSVPRPQSGTVRIFDHNRALVGVLPGQVKTTERLDGADAIDLLIPWRYGKIDGTTTERYSQITDGWYLEHRGHWYRIQDYSGKVYNNQIPVRGVSAEIELERFLTNYSQVPFSMPSHTPTEIMTAALSGLPQMGWYNGDFSELDATGFPVGWTADEAVNWAAYSGEGEPAVEASVFLNNEAELVSYALPLTTGAEIKLLLDVWAEEDFAGTITATLSWQNAAGVETSSSVATITPAAGEWATFESAAWLPVRNQKCSLKLRIYNNSDGYAVRFRAVRFVQNEDSTGWTYQGELDTRTPTIAYNDAGFQKYGTWVTDIANTLLYSATVGDVLARVFTGDMVTVRFAAGGGSAKADILVDGVLQVSGLAVSSAATYAIAGLNPYRSHVVEVVVNTATVKVLGLTISSENRIAVTWNRLDVYSALRELRALVGGEYEFDTAARVIRHWAARGDDLTAANLVWFREGANLASFEPDTETSEIRNRCYYGGHGDGAFQLGCVVDSTALDSVTGLTSIAMYGVHRFAITNKDVNDTASALAEAMVEVERQAFPTATYRSTIPDAEVGYLIPGDTVQITHQSIGTKKLRCLEVSRSSEGGAATVIWGDRATARDAAALNYDVRRKVDQLLRAY
jgi:hypothetical protein